MIVVDSSVWIANLRNSDDEQVRKLRAVDEEDEILVGDLILLEVLRGARDLVHASMIEREMRQFKVVTMLNEFLTVRATRNYVILRQRRVTLPKTINMAIATFCLEHGHQLLHDDRDFEPMVKHLGLRTA